MGSPHPRQEPIKTEKILQWLISILSLRNLASLPSWRLEEKWGVSAAAPVAAAAAPAAAEAAEEKTDFDVELTDAGASKINVIKVVRTVKPGLGLADAKKIVESAPAVLLEGVSKEEAEKAKAELEKAGAKVTIK